MKVCDLLKQKCGPVFCTCGVSVKDDLVRCFWEDMHFNQRAASVFSFIFKVESSLVHKHPARGPGNPRKADPMDILFIVHQGKL